jgi:hypothetical protein
MGIPLGEAALRLVDGKNYAVLGHGESGRQKATGYAA